MRNTSTPCIPYRFPVQTLPYILIPYIKKRYKNANLIVDAGYTEGYRNKTPSKTGGNRNHFFSKLDVNLSKDENIYHGLEVSLNHVNNDTYLDIYDLETFLNIFKSVTAITFSSSSFLTSKSNMQ